MHLRQIRVSSREATHIIEELDKVLAFNNLLISLRNHPEAGCFARGVGPISLLGKIVNWCFAFMFLTELLCLPIQTLWTCLLYLISVLGIGGEYDGDRRLDDLKPLYRAYVSDSLSSGRMEENKVCTRFHCAWLFDFPKIMWENCLKGKSLSTIVQVIVTRIEWTGTR